MLPTEKEKELKYQEIRSNYGSFFNFREVAEEYAKWYAIEVIKHCAEVADTDDECYNIVNTQSILNIINEL